MPPIRSLLIAALAAGSPLATSPASAQCQGLWFGHRQIERRFESMAAIELNGGGLAELVGLFKGSREPPALEIWSFDTALTPSREALFPDDIGIAFAAADLDGDGDADVVVHRPSTGSIHTLLNSGGSLVDSFALVASDGHACALDFDGDGDTDIAMGHIDSAVVLLNAGDGSLSPGPSAPLPGAPITVRPAELETDGRADVLVYAWVGGTPQVVPLRQTEAGELQPLALYPCRFRDAADVDGDGDTDMVAAPLFLALNNGDGSFGPLVEIRPEYDEALRLSDLDSDGDADLIANSLEEGMRILVNDGLGGFTEMPGDVGRPGAWGPVITPDMNGDGIADLVTDRGRITDVRFGRGDATFEASPFHLLFEMVIRRIVPADIDADGDIDVVAVGDGGNSKSGLAVLTNDGDGTLTQHAYVVIDRAYYYEWPVVADFDLDGDLDAALIMDDGITLFENTPTDPFQTQRVLPYELDPTYGLVLFGVDLDHNGLPDLATLGREPPYGIRSYINQGSWEFTSVFAETGAYDSLVALEDFDRDGEADAIVVDTSNGDSAMCYGLGAGAFTLPLPMNIHLSGSRDLHGYIGDLNADGSKDLMLQTITSDWFHVLLNDGFGGLYLSQSIKGYEQARGVGVGDLNGDGVDDVAISEANEWGNAGVFLSDGEGRLEGPIPFTPGHRAIRGTPIADMDGDGHNDIVAATERDHDRGGGVTVLLNPCEEPPCAADFNGDGSADTRDVIAFLNAWAAHEPGGDFDGNGLFDTRDVIAFLNAWTAGC